MSSAATSLHLLSFTQQIALSLSKPNSFIQFNPISLPFAPFQKLGLSLPPPFTLSPHSLSASRLGFLGRRVAVSSDYDQIGVLEEGPFFSPDQKLFVGNLPFSVDSAALADLFGRAGTVEMVEVIYDKHTGRSRGFGFVTMSTVEGVDAAAQQFNGYELEGRALRVNSGPPPARKESSFRGAGARGGASMDNSNRLYVRNLAWGVDNLALETLFSEQGQVMEAMVVYDRESGRSRGFGFVTYSNADEVNNALESLNGVDLNGRAIRVSPAGARPGRAF